MVYIRHLYWLQFKDHEKPVYINMVRDPVELFISNFYYLRRGFNKKNNTNSDWKWEMSNERRSETIEQCIGANGMSYLGCSRETRVDEIKIFLQILVPLALVDSQLNSFFFGIVKA